MNWMYHWIKSAARSKEFREVLKHSGSYVKRTREFFQNIKSAKWLDLNHQALDGDVASQVKLAECYYSGRGAKKDLAMSFGWFLTAAEQGHEEAALNAGMMLYAGKGVDIDQLEGGKWILLSAQQGHEAAQAAWKKIKPRYHETDLDEIRRRAAEFVPGKPSDSLEESEFVNP